MDLRARLGLLVCSFSALASCSGASTQAVAPAPVQPQPSAQCPMHAAHHPSADGSAPANPHKAHDIHHRFDDPAQWAPVFDSADRDAWQKGDAVVAALGLPAQARVADVGAATGYFSVRFARALPQGQVWGTDIEPRMVDYLQKRAATEGLPNLHAVLTKATEPELPGPMDVVFLCDVYHHLQDRVAWFHHLRKYLAPGGRLVIVDFTLGNIPVGPPVAQRIGPEAMAAELAQAGLVLQRRDDSLLPYQHLLVFVAAP